MLALTEQRSTKSPGIVRDVDVGGLSKWELIEALRRNSVSLNPLAEQLFESSHFTTSKTRFRVATVEMTVCDLGFRHGASISAIYSKAETLGLGLCPLELGPHFRLQYLDQPEGHCEGRSQEGQAPAGSVTVASPRYAEDADSPQGFYLRRIEGRLWLRGYSCAAEHEWKPDCRFVFIAPNKAAFDE